MGGTFRRVWSGLNEWMKRYPFPVPVASMTVRCAACDIIVQRSQFSTSSTNEKFKIDWPRVSIMTALGASYIAGIGHWWYLYGIPRFFPGKPFQAVVVDCLVQCNIFFYPLLYQWQEWTKDFVTGSKRPFVERVFEALRIQKDNIFEDTIVLSGYWIP